MSSEWWNPPLAATRRTDSDDRDRATQVATGAAAARSLRSVRVAERDHGCCIARTRKHGEERRRIRRKRRETDLLLHRQVAGDDGEFTAARGAHIMQRRWLGGRVTRPLHEVRAGLLPLEVHHLHARREHLVERLQVLRTLRIEELRQHRCALARKRGLACECGCRRRWSRRRLLQRCPCGDLPSAVKGNPHADARRLAVHLGPAHPLLRSNDAGGDERTTDTRRDHARHLHVVRCAVLDPRDGERAVGHAIERHELRARQQLRLDRCTVATRQCLEPFADHGRGERVQPRVILWPLGRGRHNRRRRGGWSPLWMSR